MQPATGSRLLIGPIRALRNIPSAQYRPLSSNPNASTANKQPPATPDATKTTGNQEQPPQQAVQKKSMAELDEELRLKLDNMSGEGGAAGVEYENGKAEGLKRGVKENMFRII